MNRSLFYILIFACLLTSCVKESTESTDKNPPHSRPGDVPVIELLSHSTGPVKAYEDSLRFVVKYIDGDGDLGSQDPDRHVIELIDTRDEELLVFKYHLSPRTPAGSQLVIEGELEIVLDHSILLDPVNNEEQVSYKIKLRDEMDHWSNTVETNPITVTRN